ncbi:hypothetical protein U1Q18_040473 [Sarracenia purpurea var. burkii]
MEKETVLEEAESEFEEGRNGKGELIANEDSGFGALLVFSAFGCTVYLADKNSWWAMCNGVGPAFSGLACFNFMGWRVLDWRFGRS